MHPKMLSEGNLFVWYLAIYVIPPGEVLSIYCDHYGIPNTEVDQCASAHSTSPYGKPEGISSVINGKF